MFTNASTQLAVKSFSQFKHFLHEGRFFTIIQYRKQETVMGCGAMARGLGRSWKKPNAVPS